jgi:hypothetical protein
LSGPPSTSITLVFFFLGLFEFFDVFFKVAWDGEGVFNATGGVLEGLDGVRARDNLEMRGRDAPGLVARSSLGGAGESSRAFKSMDLPSLTAPSSSEESGEMALF